MTSVEEVFKSMEKMSSFYATTITSATPTTSTPCSKLSVVQRVTQFSQKRGIWNCIWLLVVILLHIFTEKCLRTEKNAFQKMNAFNIPYKNEQKLFENLAVFDSESICLKEDSNKQTETTTWSGERVPKAVFVALNLIPETIFSATPNFIISSCLLLRSRKIGNSKQSSDEIDFY